MATEKQLDKSFDDLMKAAAKYVELRGGKLAVSGGVQVIKYPSDLKYNWTLGIRCTGTPPQASQPPARVPCRICSVVGCRKNH
jgi:hypothetical protein